MVRQAPIGHLKVSPWDLGGVSGRRDVAEFEQRTIFSLFMSGRWAPFNTVRKKNYILLKMWLKMLQGMAGIFCYRKGSRKSGHSAVEYKVLLQVVLVAGHGKQGAEGRWWCMAVSAKTLQLICWAGTWCCVINNVSEHLLGTFSSCRKKKVN